MAPKPRKPGQRAAPRPTHWEVEFYERVDGTQPAEVFFQDLDWMVFGRLQGYIDTIVTDPISFPPGPAWQAMSGVVVGRHEVRVRVGNQLYRVYVKLDSGPFPGFPRLGRFVLLDGQSKPIETALPPAVYEGIAQFAVDYLQTRKVSPPGGEE